MILNTTLRMLRPAAAVLASLALAGCITPGSGGSSYDNTVGSAPTTAVTSEPLAPIGGGQVKAALILPLSSGNAGNLGQSMRNASEMALAEFNNPNVQLIVKDDGGTAQGAANATQQAISEGAEIVLGPVFAQSVVAAGQTARRSNIPVIAFSTDSSAATRGVYLLGFLPQSDIERVVSFATHNGKRSFAALLPDNAYGSVVEGAFQESVARNGGRVVGLEHYSSGNEKEAVRRIAQAAKSADAILLPEGGDTAARLVRELTAAGVDTKRVALLGSGQWDDPRVTGAPELAGAYYPGPDSAGWRSFSQRYQNRYGSQPPRTATLAYDAVLLVAALTQTQGQNRFSEGVLTNASGFQGVDGIFRLKSNGTNERGLAVMQIQSGGVKVVSPAPRSFAASASL